MRKVTPIHLSGLSIEPHDDTLQQNRSQGTELLAVEFTVGILQIDYCILSILDKAKRTDWNLEGTDGIFLQNTARKELYHHKTNFLPPHLCRGHREV